MTTNTRVQCRLGQAVIKKKSTRGNVTYIDPNNGPPYLSLTFRYRPKGIYRRSLLHTVVDAVARDVASSRDYTGATEARQSQAAWS